MNVFEIFGRVGLKDEASKGLDNVVGNAKNTSGQLAGIFKKTAGVIATVFAVDKIIDFGKMAVESAATLKAIDAQFEQVFEGIGTKANQALEGVAKEVGALPNRIKPAFSQIASFAKVSGMDTQQALSFTERATKAAADTAAFYDQSLETTTETLKSYLKGNYQVADNLGILSTETTRNAAATELFGKKFSELDGLQQQEVLLKMYEDANKVSGAMGQAAREADGWENVMGNLKQAWQDFLALVGAPLLSMLIPVIQSVTSKLVEFGEYIPQVQKNLGDFWNEFSNSTLVKSAIKVFDQLKEKIKQMFDSFKNGGDTNAIVQIFNTLKDVILNIDLTKVIQDINNFIKTFAPLIAGIMAAIGAFKLITGAIALFSGISSAISIIGSLISSVGLLQTVFTFLAPAVMPVIAAITSISAPVLIAAGVIGALVAAGIYLWQNWETIGPRLGEIWQIVQSTVSAAITGVIQWFSNLWSQGTQYISSLASDIGSWFSQMASTVGTKASDMFNSVVEWFGQIPGKIQELWNQAQSFLDGINLFSIGQNIVSGLWNGLKSMWSSLTNWFSGAVGGLVDQAKRVLSIFSPSRKFRDLVGRFIPLGIKEGAEKEFPTLNKSMEDNLNNLLDIKPAMDNIIPIYKGNSGLNYPMLNSDYYNNSNLNNMLQEIMVILKNILNKDTNSYMDTTKVSREIDDPLRKYQEIQKQRKNRIVGVY